MKEVIKNNQDIMKMAKEKAEKAIQDKLEKESESEHLIKRESLRFGRFNTFFLPFWIRLKKTSKIVFLGRP